MRLAAYVLMLVLLAAAMVSGDLRLALAAAGLKAIVVGLEFMELRHAARGHMVGFVLGIAAVAGLLVTLVTTA